MNLFKKIDIKIFFIAFVFGLFMCYIMQPAPRIIIKYPTPETEDQVYIDDSKTCYKYMANEIKCPKDRKLIKEVPIQQTIFMDN